MNIGNSSHSQLIMWWVDWQPPRSAFSPAANRGSPASNPIRSSSALHFLPAFPCSAHSI